MDEVKALPYRIELYRDVSHDWRWRLWARNGKLVASCGEGYRNRQDCLRMIHKLFPMIQVPTKRNEITALITTGAS